MANNLPKNFILFIKFGAIKREKIDFIYIIYI